MAADIAPVSLVMAILQPWPPCTPCRLIMVSPTLTSWISAVRSSPLARLVRACFLVKSSQMKRGRLTASGVSLMQSLSGEQSKVSLVAQMTGDLPSSPAAASGNALPVIIAVAASKASCFLIRDLRSLHRIAAALHAGGHGAVKGIAALLRLRGLLAAL